jgi:hypothetical protein
LPAPIGIVVSEVLRIACDYSIFVARQLRFIRPESSADPGPKLRFGPGFLSARFPSSRTARSPMTRRARANDLRSHIDGVRPALRTVHRRCDIDGAMEAQDHNAPPRAGAAASPFSFEG